MYSVQSSVFAVASKFKFSKRNHQKQVGRQTTLISLAAYSGSLAKVDILELAQVKSLEIEKASESNRYLVVSSFGQISCPRTRLTPQKIPVAQFLENQIQSAALSPVVAVGSRGVLGLFYQKSLIDRAEVLLSADTVSDIGLDRASADTHIWCLARKIYTLVITGALVWIIYHIATTEQQSTGDPSEVHPF